MRTLVGEEQSPYRLLPDSKVEAIFTSLLIAICVKYFELKYEKDMLNGYYMQ